MEYSPRKLMFADFEFNSSNEEFLNLVCCAVDCYDGSKLTFSRDFWLFSRASKEYIQAKEFFKKRIEEGYILVCFSSEAEVRSLRSLFQPDFKPLKNLQCIDLQINYRLLLNENHEWAYGDQLIKGQVKKTKFVDKYDKNKVTESIVDSSLPETNLASTTFKLLGVLIDTQEKTDVRELIIRNNSLEIKSNRLRIQKYCRTDIDYLPRIYVKLRHLFTTVGEFTDGAYFNSSLKFGDYGIASAKMTEFGLPIDDSFLQKLPSAASSILRVAQEACLTASEEFKLFRFNPKKDSYVQNIKEVRRMVKSFNLKDWPLTEGGKSGKRELSLSKDAFERYFDSSSPGLVGEYYRFLSTKMSLNGFQGSKASSKFYERYGSDNRVRPYFNIFGSKTSRSQPKAAQFPFLKAHWMRRLVQPRPGKWMVSFDYGSQEFLVAAILSQDLKMINSYASGDVYLGFAKLAGLAPQSATKKTHKEIRDTMKSFVLGMSYDMGAESMARKLTLDTGVKKSKEEAQTLIDKFFSTYSTYRDWKKKVKDEYFKTKHFLRLPDGWTIWGDNPRFRSVGNFPIQGMSAYVMREAVKACYKSGVKIVATLHDALYAEIDRGDFDAVNKFREIMVSDFERVFKPWGVTAPITTEGFIWGEGASGFKGCLIGCEFEEVYIDAKGRSDFEKYRRFFE